MSVNTKFEAYKVSREIKRSGSEYYFHRDNKNEFGEPTNTAWAVNTEPLKGLYHEETMRITKTLGDTTEYRSKKLPKILCLHEDVVGLELEVGDHVVINGVRMDLTGIENIQEWNIISDISLEVIDDGRLEV